MGVVVSHRVEADPRAKLPPGATEAWFAYHMSKTIRAGLGGDFDAPQVAFGVRTPVRIKPGDPEFEHMLEFEGKVYVTAARIQELTGWTYINVMTYASRDMWPRINHPKGGRFKMYALDAAMATHHSVKLHLKTVQRAA